MVVGIRVTRRATSTATEIRAARTARKARNGQNRREHKNDGQADEQDGQRDLVWRLLPLGAFDQRDHAIEEALARIGRDAHADLVGDDLRCRRSRAERSPPASRITGAHSPVIAASLTEATPAITSPSAGMRSPAADHHHVAGLRAGAGDLAVLLVAAVAGGRAAPPCFRCGSFSDAALRLAAAFGQRLGEGAEQHREPEPEDELQRECRTLRARHARITSRITVSSAATQAATNITGFRTMLPRIELAESRADRWDDDLRIEHGP